MVGGPESLLALADAGELRPAPTVLAGDLPDGLTTGGVLLTDGLRRREVAFGQARDNASATLTADEPWRLDQPAHDYLPAWQARWQTVARYLGVRSITASSAYSQALPLAGEPAGAPAVRGARRRPGHVLALGARHGRDRPVARGRPSTSRGGCARSR